MLELYLFGGVGLAALFLWWQNGSLKSQLKHQTRRADMAEKLADHNEKVATVARERNNTRAERVEEIVHDAENDEFSDFYSDDHN